MTSTDAEDRTGGAARAGARAPVRLTRHVFVSFLPSSMPLLSRMNYRRELTATFFIPLVLAPVEGGVAGVIVKNAYEGVVPDVALNFVVAALVAAPAFANVCSFFWARVAHGLDKVRFINALQVGMVLSVAAMALSPRTPTGLVVMLALVLATRLCYSGVITLRSTVWGVNYPRGARARVAGKLTTVQVLVVAALGYGLGEAMEWWPPAFRVMLPVGAAAALVGVLAWSRVRLRGRRRLLRMEREHGRADRPSLNPLGIIAVMRGDRRYDAYMSCQMLLGLGNMMTWAPVVIMVKDVFQYEYRAVSLTHSIPLLIMPLSIPLWSRLLDRRHVVFFRSIHSWIFVASTLLVFGSGMLVSLPLLTLGVVLKGFAFGGGALAWNLGHHDFAPEGRQSQYMAAHVTLTGLRGLIAPFVGVALYQVFESARPGAGPWVFAVASAITCVGALGFVALHRSMSREGAESIGRDLPAAGGNP